MDIKHWDIPVTTVTLRPPLAPQAVRRREEPVSPTGKAIDQQSQLYSHHIRPYLGKERQYAALESRSFVCGEYINVRTAFAKE